MGPKRARIALLGAGHWGRNHLRVLSELGALRVVVDPDPAAREKTAASWPDVSVVEDPRGVWDDSGIDAVVIATPAATHAEVARAALDSGKDVLVEKPLALRESDADALVAMARERGRILMVGHVLWYHPAVRALEALVREGRLGRLRYLYSHRLNLGRFRREEDILWSFAPHDISVILGLVGAEPVSVSAESGSYLRHGVADVTVTQLGFPNGVRAHVFVSWLHPFREQRLVVVGEAGMAVFDPGKESAPLMLYPHHVRWEADDPIPERAEGIEIPFADDEPLRCELEAFLEAIRTRKPPRTDGEEGRTVLRVLGRARDAMERGRAMAETEDGVHPTAIVEAGAGIGQGTRVWHWTHVMPGARIGRDGVLGQNVFIGRNVRIGDRVKIQNNVSVFEGVEIEDGVFCGPSAVFTNVLHPRAEVERKDRFLPTRVGRGATIGANATIVCGVTIGEGAFVGAGAVVTKDVPAQALVVGSPARIVGHVCICGRRLPEGSRPVCDECGREWVVEGGEVSERRREG